MTKKEIVKRQKEIKVRLTEAEHQALLERMTGGELATWIRQTCLEEKPNKKRNYKVADPQLLAGLGRIGGNLNQIARQVNTVESDIEKIRAFAELAMIREQLQKVLADYDR
ncbi:Conjugative accessory protein mbeC [Acinetobacter baumannii]|uniref:plasmid mobilization protein n=1 Tax=Acinetobacter baumannii TaxID=470 RepID=UPI000DE79149|nr:plasmid mobilization relaxosome protein MobC [Acinetobacter baumannii]SSR14595.1 Conjugative accessory protein mbeC [Acinetobacter baumannii]